MSLSRLRLRLAAWFALAFVVGLTVLNLTLYAYLRHQSGQRLTRSLRNGAVDLVHAIQFEYGEDPAAGLAAAAKEALAEWVHPGVFVVYTEHGDRLISWGDKTNLRHMPPSLDITDTTVVDVATSGAYPLRQVTVAAQDSP